MNESEQNKPEDFWKKAFDDASEMPPLRVWDAIERRLDKSEDGLVTGPNIVPLWGSGLVLINRFAWPTGIAAAFALLLAGWWSLSSDVAQKPVAQHRSIDRPHPQSTGLPPALPAQTPNAAINKMGVHSAEAIAKTGGKSIKDMPQNGHPDEQTVILAPMEVNGVVARTMRQPTPEIQAIHPVPASPGIVMPSTNQLTYGAQPLPSERRSVVMSRVASAAFIAIVDSTTNEPQADPFSVITAEQLAGRPLQRRNLEPIQRIVWINPLAGASEEKTTQSTQKSREVWASVSVMPGAFDPSVSVRSAQTFSSQAFSNAVALTSSSVGSSQRSVDSRAGLSVTYQAIAGIQVTPRWSVESGIGYLSGHSSIESPAQVTAYSNTISAINRLSTSGNLYVNALRNSLPTTYKSSVADLVAYPSQLGYDAQSQQRLTNNYRFVQVPVQVGYQLRPRKRFGLAVLGGLLTNIFVRNTVGDNVVVNSKDGVYRPLSWSATMGARFRYRPSRRWSASLAGLYQTAFGSGTEATSQVQNRLSATGMSFGVDYHF